MLYRVYVRKGSSFTAHYQELKGPRSLWALVRYHTLLSVILSMKLAPVHNTKRTSHASTAQKRLVCHAMEHSPPCGDPRTLLSIGPSVLESLNIRATSEVGTWREFWPIGGIMVRLSDTLGMCVCVRACVCLFVCPGLSVYVWWMTWRGRTWTKSAVECRVRARLLDSYRYRCGWRMHR